MTETAAREATAGQRQDLVELLTGLDEEQWAAPSLCAGWRVREVVAHMTMPYRLSSRQFLMGMIKAGGRFNRMSDRQAKADAARLSDAELLASLRDNVHHPWKPPGGGYIGALSHDVIHGLDITIALGLDHLVPVEWIRMILEEAGPKQVRYFGVDLDGVRLRADDLDWSFGTGEGLTGRAQHLLMVLCGRRLPSGLVHGSPAARFARAE
ncbi:maleylpyruvate isomerase family mycothiol-dependent enzyme [Nocardia brevicatena]|uniref:maleylpyruvate isomerase family mycothiol-dependent enzyme n=1 Tax=Nocardia brevicatena TaxID=37327 RepID=UPI000307D633|nr:maleylpyruvate isomerase family mycothiol-dependent enzyme [Nocardia brevicatena]